MLAWIACAGAVICLAYYAAIVVYAGFSVSFSWFWLMLAIFLGMTSAGMQYGHFHPKKIPVWLPVSVATVGITAVIIFCAVEILVFLGAATADAPGLDYVIVLGAKIREEGISNSLKQRLDKAVEYSMENPGTVFILSGGQGSDEPEPEAQAMRDYMVYHGVPESRLVMETVSSSTVENLAYSRVVIDGLEKKKREEAGNNVISVIPGPFLEVEEKPIQVGVLTSNYHVFRARRIGEKWGLKGIHGISARSDILLFPHLCVRECIAILKDQLMGNM